MLYIKSFANYDEFKNLFGIAEHGNGNKSRKNRILLSLYKDKNVWKAAHELQNYFPFTINSMAALKTWLMENVADSSYGGYRLSLMGINFWNGTYETDSLGGVCQDGDTKCVRYVKHDGGECRVMKMKAGKLLSKIIDECRFGQYMNETLRIWLCEEFAADWLAYSKEHTGSYTLHTGRERSDFDGIYGGFRYKGDFGSCMMDEGYSDFYYDAVDATAAWLEDSEGYMVARAVIYNKVYERGSGKVWRLCERQYTSDGDESLKRLLVLKLIGEGLIDGYKQIGASCHDSQNFVTNDGESLRGKKFWIDCSLSSGDTLSYQDSFKNFLNGQADNWSGDGISLSETSGVFDGAYDSWHDDYCEEVVTVYCNGSEYTCDVNRLDDFREVETHYGDYYYEDDVVWDSCRGEYILNEDAIGCYDGDYHYDSDCVVLYDGNYALYRETVELHDGEYALIDDAILYRNEYYLEEELKVCKSCDEYFLPDEGFFSELTGESYCCESCMLDAEENYRKEHALVAVCA